MAGVYFNQGKYKEALTMYEKALSIRLKKLGDDHPNVAETYNNMAVYFKQGKYEEALTMYEKTLSIRLKKLGDDHPDVTATKNCIQAILEKLHPNVATTYHNMAGIYKDQGNLKEANVRECSVDPIEEIRRRPS